MVTTYKVYQDGVLVASPSASPLTITGLTNDHAYSFAASSVVDGVEGAKSAPLVLTPRAASTPGPTPTGWAAKPAFMSYPGSAAINHDGGSDIEISGKSFNAIAYPAAAIRMSGVHNLWIHDVDFRDLDWDAIDILGCTGLVKIEWCRFGNLGAHHIASPMGRVAADFVQFDGSVVSGFIANCKGIGNDTEDLINFYQSGGTGPGDLFEVRDCQFQGTGWVSTSGTGSLLADNTTTTGHIWWHHNSLLDTGQVGVGISQGLDCHVTDSVIYGHQRANSNVGIYTPYSGGANPGGHEVARNRVFWKRADGSLNAFSPGGSSGAVAGLSPQTNVWDDATIDPATLAVTL